MKGGACLALATAFATATAACAGSHTHSPVADAGSKLAAQGTVRAAAEFTANRKTVRTELAIDFKRGRARSAFDEPLGDPKGPTELRILDGTEYLRYGAGPTWVRATDRGGIVAVDPGALLTSLQKGVREVSDVGTEEVRGTRTTHYHLVVDAGRLLQPSAGKTTVPLDVWVDSNGLVRRVRYVSGEGTKTEGRAQFEFYDFGAKLDIEAPPADQVTDGPIGDDAITPQTGG